VRPHPPCIFLSYLTDPPSAYPDIDYRHFDSANIDPRYEFGYGLSYTTFSYSGLSIKTLVDLRNVPAGEIQPGGMSGLWNNAVSATFTVKNTGAYAGNEVAQLYIVRVWSCFYQHLLLNLDCCQKGFPKSAMEPPRVLRGFDRQFINIGNSVQVNINLRVKDISIWLVVLVRLQQSHGLILDSCLGTHQAHHGSFPEVNSQSTWARLPVSCICRRHFLFDLDSGLHGNYIYTIQVCMGLLDTEKIHCRFEQVSSLSCTLDYSGCIFRLPYVYNICDTLENVYIVRIIYVISEWY